jgi:hypothetical protein
MNERDAKLREPHHFQWWEDVSKPEGMTRLELIAECAKTIYAIDINNYLFLHIPE